MVKNKKRLNKILLYLCGSFVIILWGICLYKGAHLNKLGNTLQLQNKEYSKHYVMITEDTSSSFWNRVYKAAQNEAETHDAYIEYMKQEYSVLEKLKIAINCKVDGIILEADETEEMKELINEAVEQGIAVTTVLNDCPTSNKQSYIGIDTYHLGKIYAQQILELYKEHKVPVAVIMDLERPRQEQKVIYMSISKVLQEAHAPITLQAININGEDQFTSEEGIRNIVVNEKYVPSIMVCLNDIDTRCIYQAVIDYNKVDQIKILGCYTSEDIIQAVKEGIITATVAVNAEQMGQSAVQTLEAYKTGYVDNYLLTDVKLVTSEMVQDYLLKEGS